MPVLPILVVRDDVNDASTTLTPTMVALLAVLLTLLILGILAALALLLLRSIRRRGATSTGTSTSASANTRKPTGPRPANHKRHSHRRLTITTTPCPSGHAKTGPSVSVSEKQAFLAGSGNSSPTSPVPEIRITFPEEEDDGASNGEKGGKRTSGRVVVVRIGEMGAVGMEPWREEDEKARRGERLPPYGRDGETWASLDLERIGGLREKV